MKTVSLTPDFVLEVVAGIHPKAVGKAHIKAQKINLTESDSYGPSGHRTWVFTAGVTEEVAVAAGSIERYWAGLKMICSVMGAPPRTYFFTEDGQRASAALLKTLGQNNEKKEEHNVTQ